MTATLICGLLVIILGITLYLTGLVCKKLQEEKSRLEVELSKQKKVSQELLRYAEEIAKINSDKDNVAQQIEEAENDEEVLAIIAGLVSDNNDRVRK